MAEELLYLNASLFAALLGISLHNSRKIAKVEERVQLLYDQLSVKLKFKE